MKTFEKYLNKIFEASDDFEMLMNSHGGEDNYTKLANGQSKIFSICDEIKKLVLESKDGEKCNNFLNELKLLIKKYENF